MLSPVLMFALHSAAAPANTDAAPRIVSVETHTLHQSATDKQKAAVAKNSNKPAVVTKTVAHIHADGTVSMDCKTEHPKNHSEIQPTEPQ
jgi:hypothetical protein